MRDNERYVYIATLVFVLIAGLVFGRAFEWVWAAVELVPYSVFGIPQLPLTGVMGFALAAIGGLAVIKNETTKTLGEEVVDELSRVTWPQREETTSSTVVVVVAVIISAVFIGVFDQVWGALTKSIFTAVKTII